MDEGLAVPATNQERRQKRVAKRRKKEMVPKNEGKRRSSLIADADLWASRAVRILGLRDDGLVSCYTCGKKFYPKHIQCGHFVGRAHFSVRFDLRNMRPQCIKCNTYRSGEPGMYALNLIEELGFTGFKEMLELGAETILPSDDKLKEIATYYRDLTAKLLEEKQIHPWW